VAAGRLAADGEIELFVIEKVVVHGRLLLFDEGRSASSCQAGYDPRRVGAVTAITQRCDSLM
jgi:hypothetical protein